MKELIELFEARRRSPHVPVVVATVLRVEGSSYRRPGARMLINIHGRVAGSVSGGCLEKSVISQARIAMLDGNPRLLSYDTTDANDFALGSSLGCEGRIWIGLEVLRAGQSWPLETTVDRARRRREPAALVTRIQRIAGGFRFASTALFSSEEDELEGALSQEVSGALANHKSRFVGDQTAGGALIEWLAPPLRLVLLGGGYDVPPMVRLARELGHEVLVIDRRPDIARPENFPRANRVIASNPSAIPSHLSPDQRTVAVIMNHHYDTDRDALAALLPLHLPYIALLGPKRRTERIIEELEGDGCDVSPEILQTIHGPAGLDIGAETPEQIGLAILAEIQSVLAGRDGSKLRERAAPIHAEAPHHESPCLLPA
jgi:xanthine dehydrogenase accessory factor